MAVETSEQVQQYLILSQKTKEELQAICEGLKLDTTGNQEILLDRLIQLGAPAQTDFMQPQLIPLRSRTDDGDLIEAANKALLYWRAQIYNAKDNYKEFKMLNSKGKTYTLKMKYILCPQAILQKILKDKWYDPRYTAQGELINLLSTKPEAFTLSIVQRPTKQGKSYIMLHVEANKVA